MTIMSAAVFFSSGYAVSSIEETCAICTPLVGKFASLFFAIALLSAGLSSSVTGTRQYILEGFLKATLPIWIQGLITMIPTVLIIGIEIKKGLDLKTQSM